MSLSNWMAGIPDSRSLSDIAMPGTHDTATYDLGALGLVTKLNIIAWRAMRFAQTQSKTVREQLDLGVRFLDLRIMPDGKGGFDMYHGAVSLGSDFNTILGDIEAFLKANPKETVLACFKKESNDGRAETSAELASFLAKRGSTYFLEPRIPTLKEVRGKVVVINRIYDKPDSGIFIWFEDDQIFEKVQSQSNGTIITFAVQDRYGVAQSDKLNAIAEGYKKFDGGTHQMRIAFASATSFPLHTPGEIAEDINPQMRRLLRDNAKKSKWITVLDYVGVYGSGNDEPVASIISTNEFGKGPGIHRDTLNAGETLSLGEELLSANGAFKAVFQTHDGNFVVYRLCDGHAMAATMSNGKGADRATLQTDGNFVVYAGTAPKSDTATNGKGAVRMVMQSDGNLVLYKADGSAVWASDSQKFVTR